MGNCHMGPPWTDRQTHMTKNRARFQVSKITSRSYIIKKHLQAEKILSIVQSKINLAQIKII